MEKPFTKSGGARIGWVSASGPLARLSASSENLTVAVRILGTYKFTPDQVFNIESCGLIPFLSWGIRIRHNVLDYPKRIIFLSSARPESLLNGIRDAGFIARGAQEVDPLQRGIPLRWSAIIVAVIFWNLPYAMPFRDGKTSDSFPSFLALIPLYGSLLLSIAILKMPTLQRIVLRPHRSVGQIAPFLRLLIFITGLLSFIFTILLATGVLKQVSPDRQ